MYKKLAGFGLSDIQIKSVMKLYDEREQFKKAEEGLIESIKGYGAKNASIVKKLLSKEGMKFENGKITGFEQQIEAMKSDPETAFLFEETDKTEINEVEEISTENEDFFMGIIPSESEAEISDENLSYEDLCEIL